MGLIGRASLTWLGFFALAMVNGILREAGIKRFVGEPWAHHLSVFTAILLFGLYGWSMRDRLALSSLSDAIVTGSYWLVLTVLTETFVIGRWMGKHSWDEILANYDILHGNLWPLVLVFVAILPYLIYRLQASLRGA